MKRNIVGSIIIISLLFWVPMSCCMHFCIVRLNNFSGLKYNRYYKKLFYHNRIRETDKFKSKK